MIRGVNLVTLTAISLHRLVDQRRVLESSVHLVVTREAHVPHVRYQQLGGHRAMGRMAGDAASGGDRAMQIFLAASDVVVAGGAKLGDALSLEHELVLAAVR